MDNKQDLPPSYQDSTYTDEKNGATNQGNLAGQNAAGAYPPPHPAAGAYPVQTYAPPGTYPQQPLMQQPGVYQQQNLVFAPPGQVYNSQNQAYEPEPENYRVFAIMTMLFCCFPLGIVAFLKSAEVSTAYGHGDIIRSKNSSRDAKKYSQMALGCGVLNWLCMTIFIVVYVILILPSFTRNY